MRLGLLPEAAPCGGGARIHHAALVKPKGALRWGGCPGVHELETSLPTSTGIAWPEIQA